VHARVRLVALLLAASTLIPQAVTLAAQDNVRRLYVNVLDKDGKPVEGLSAADFTVKEGGKTREISRAEPARGPLQIAILVDDNGTGLFRVEVARFIESLLGRAQFSVSTVTGQTMRLVDYTTDVKQLSAAVRKLGTRPGTNDGNQLLDGITGTSLDMAKRKAARPIIVALTVGGTDVTPMEADDALNQLRRSGAALHVVSVLNSAMRATPTGPTRAGDLISEGHALHAMLGDGPRRSGGHREEISAMAGVETGLLKLAEQLKHQYLIEYSLGADKPSDRVAVAVTMPGVTLRAPTHVPGK
jgi:VWFA-related protein